MKLGEKKEKRLEMLSDMKSKFEAGWSIQSIADKYGVSKQCISEKLRNAGYYPREVNKAIKRYRLENGTIERQKEEILRLRKKLRYMEIYNWKLKETIKKIRKENKHGI